MSILEQQERHSHYVHHAGSSARLPLQAQLMLLLESKMEQFV